MHIIINSRYFRWKYETNRFFRNKNFAKLFHRIIEGKVFKISWNKIKILVYKL